jgi:hypothetical protein
LRVLNHQCVNALLSDAVTARGLAHQNSLCLAPPQSHDLGAHEAVVQDHVSLVESAQGIERQESGITRACANQLNASTLTASIASQRLLQKLVGVTFAPSSHEIAHRSTQQPLVEATPGVNIRNPRLDRGAPPPEEGSHATERLIDQ